METLGGGWTAEEAVAIAMACVFGLGATDPLAALVAAANHSGDTDSTAAVAGNILGAMHGSAFLPEAWTVALDVVGMLERTADEFLAAFDK